MPERKDTENTTDQARSGGMQTQEPNRPGQGSSAATDPEMKDSRGRFDDEMQKREVARDSKHSGNSAEEWSPGTHQSNT